MPKSKVNKELDSRQITADYLRRFEPLSTLSKNHLRQLLSHIHLIKVKQGKILFKRNQPCKYYYYLAEGSIDLLDAQFNATHLSATDALAKQPLDTNSPHQFSAVTTMPSRILRLRKGQLDLALTWSQAEHISSIDEEVSDEAECENDDWMSCLLTSDLMKKISPSNIHQLMVQFKVSAYKANDTVIEEGEHGSTFYVIIVWQG